MKAYGFLLQNIGIGGDVYGECFAEDGKWLGGWTSSDVEWLKRDLETHAKTHDMEYSFHTNIMEVPEAVRNAASNRQKLLNFEKPKERRILTLDIELDPATDAAAWIWESHMNLHKYINGCKVRVIAEGSLDDQIKNAIEEF